MSACKWRGRLTDLSGVSNINPPCDSRPQQADGAGLNWAVMGWVGFGRDRMDRVVQGWGLY